MVAGVLGAGGTMGKGMARILAGAGIAVRAWNRTREKLAELEGEERIVACDTAAEAARGADLVITILSDGDAVLAAMQGEDGGLAGADAGLIWVQASTIGIAATDRCAALADSAGLRFVDSPVLGTKQPAEEGQLVVLASGPAEAQDELAPVFDAIGKRTVWVGEAGAGSRLKVAVNAWIVSVVEGTAEMLALAEALGLDPKLPLETIADGPLDLPYLQLKGKAMLDRSFDPSFKLSLAAKDAGLALEAARAEGLELPMLAAIRDRMEAASDEHGDKDLAAVYLASAPSD